MKVQLQSNSAVDKIAKSTEQFQTTLLEALGDKTELPRSLTAKNFKVGYNLGGEVQITVKFKPKKAVGKAKAQKLKDDSASIKLARKPGTHSKALFKELNAGKAFPRKVFGTGDLRFLQEVNCLSQLQWMLEATTKQISYVSLL